MPSGGVHTITAASESIIRHLLRRAGGTDAAGGSVLDPLVNFGQALVDLGEPL